MRLGILLSCRLMFRSFRRIVEPKFGPPSGPAFPGPRMPVTALPVATRPDVPLWTAKLIADHIATCVECRESYVGGTLPLLEPSTISRILALVEDHKPGVAP
jgi:hypothetical protein